MKPPPGGLWPALTLWPHHVLTWERAPYEFNVLQVKVKSLGAICLRGWASRRGEWRQKKKKIKLKRKKTVFTAVPQKHTFQNPISIFYTFYNPIKMVSVNKMICCAKHLDAFFFSFLFRLHFKSPTFPPKSLFSNDLSRRASEGRRGKRRKAHHHKPDKAQMLIFTAATLSVSDYAAAARHVCRDRRVLRRDGVMYRRRDRHSLGKAAGWVCD